MHCHTGELYLAEGESYCIGFVTTHHVVKTVIGRGSTQRCLKFTEVGCCPRFRTFSRQNKILEDGEGSSSFLANRALEENLGELTREFLYGLDLWRAEERTSARSSASPYCQEGGIQRPYDTYYYFSEHA